MSCSIARRGHPLRLAMSNPAQQQLYCAHRSSCLRWAAVRNWPGFSCAGCDDLELAPLSDVVAEHSGLLVLVAVVCDPTVRRRGDIRSRPRGRGSP